MKATRIIVILTSLVLLACLAYFLDGGASLQAQIANDRALDRKFAPVLQGTTLPHTELVYHSKSLSSAYNGGGCVYRVSYIFVTTLSETDFMTAYDNVPSYYRPSWIEPVKLHSDKTYAQSFSAEEIAIIEAILTTPKNAARLLRVDTINFGIIRNGLDKRCGNFD